VINNVSFSSIRYISYNNIIQSRHTRRRSVAKYLSRPNSRTGLSVVRRDRVVDVDEDSRLVTSVDTGDGDERARGSTTAVGDFDLTARDVELRATEGRCDVESNGFHADEVLSGGECFRQGKGHSRDTFGRESDALSTVRDGRDLVNLEPDIAVSSPAIDGVGRLGHVHIDDTWVVNGSVTHNTQLLTSGDLGGGGSSRLSRIVATEVGAGDVRDGRLSVEVVSRTDINPCRGRRPIDNERRERVVGKSLCGEHGSDEAGEQLHFDCWVELELIESRYRNKASGAVVLYCSVVV